MFLTKFEIFNSYLSKIDLIKEYENINEQFSEKMKMIENIQGKFEEMRKEIEDFENRIFHIKFLSVIIVFKYIIVII